MQKRWTVIGIACLGLVAVVAVSGWAGDDEEEAKISLDQAPAAVRDALVKLANGAEIVEVEQEKEHGCVFYEAKWVVNGHETEAKVTAEGALVGMEAELAASDVPAAVKAAAAKKFPAGATPEFEQKTTVMYEVTADIDGKEVELLISPGGKILKGDKKECHGGKEAREGKGRHHDDGDGDDDDDDDDSDDDDDDDDDDK